MFAFDVTWFGVHISSALLCSSWPGRTREPLSGLPSLISRLGNLRLSPQYRFPFDFGPSKLVDRSGLCIGGPRALHWRGHDPWALGAVDNMRSRNLSTFGQGSAAVAPGTLRWPVRSESRKPRCWARCPPCPTCAQLGWGSMPRQTPVTWH